MLPGSLRGALFLYLRPPELSAASPRMQARITVPVAVHRDGDGVAQDGNVPRYTRTGKCSKASVLRQEFFRMTRGKRNGQGRADVQATNQNRPSKNIQRVSFPFALWRSAGQIIRTTRIAGGLLWPCKGLLPAAPKDAGFHAVQAPCPCRLGYPLKGS